MAIQTRRKITAKILALVLAVVSLILVVVFIQRAGGITEAFQTLKEGSPLLLLVAVILILLSKIIQSLAWYVYFRMNSISHISLRQIFLVYCSAYGMALISPISSVGPYSIGIFTSVLKIPIPVAVSCWLISTYLSMLAFGLLAIVLTSLVSNQALFGGSSSFLLSLGFISVLLGIGSFMTYILLHVRDSNPHKIIQNPIIRLLQERVDEIKIILRTQSLRSLIRIMILQSYLPWSLQIFAVLIGLKSMGVSTISLTEVMILWTVASAAGRIAPGLLSIGVGQLSWSIVLTQMGVSPEIGNPAALILPFTLFEGPTLLLGLISSISLIKQQSSNKKTSYH